MVERLETLQQSYQTLQESRQDALQQMCDAMTRRDSRLSSHSTTLTRMENQILDTNDRVTVVESSMKSLQNEAASIAIWRSMMEAGARKMAEQLTRLTNVGGASNNQRGYPSNSSFFIGGCMPSGNGMKITMQILQRLSAASGSRHSCLLDGEIDACRQRCQRKGNRLAARAMIVTMRSPMM